MTDRVGRRMTDRVGRVRISLEVLAEAFLPAGSTIRDASTSDTYGELWLIVEHPDFEERLEGDWLPIETVIAEHVEKRWLR